MAERLRADFPYQPPTDLQSVQAEADDVIEMEPFEVIGEKDRSRETTKILAEKQRIEMEKKPSLARGASLENERISVGLRPDKSLFKPVRAITPKWTIIDLKF